MKTPKKLKLMILSLILTASPVFACEDFTGTYRIDDVFSSCTMQPFAAPAVMMADSIVAPGVGDRAVKDALGYSANGAAMEIQVTQSADCRVLRIASDPQGTLDLVVGTNALGPHPDEEFYTGATNTWNENVFQQSSYRKKYRMPGAWGSTTKLKKVSNVSRIEKLADGSLRISSEFRAEKPKYGTSSSCVFKKIAH